MSWINDPYAAVLEDVSGRSPTLIPTAAEYGFGSQSRDTLLKKGIVVKVSKRGRKGVGVGELLLVPLLSFVCPTLLVSTRHKGVALKSENWRNTPDRPLTHCNIK